MAAEVMNEHLLERFKRSQKLAPGHSGQAQVLIQPPRLNPKVRQYFEDSKKRADGGAWLDRPEIPTSHEVLDIDPDDGSGPEVIEIVPNRPTGAWESKEAYLSAHYEMLREDAVRPLREAIQHVRATPAAAEDAFQGGIGIYEKVHICGITCSTRGMATRITFSLVRAGKKILWEQSKRLIAGSLVVLTPVEDMFNTQAIVATVAARPLAGVEQNPPEIDIFIARSEEQEIDPAKEYVMVEDRGGLYEAERHTLMALQRMMQEPFPLSKYIVDVQKQISAPESIKRHPQFDMRPVFIDNKHETYENVDILHSWPKQPPSDMDISQLAALRRILTKELAVVQGPPGTGKTHVSVQAVKTLIANWQENDPPIIIACQTNHAVDQILKHIAAFEPNFVRLGGRSKDRGVIYERTLYAVRNQTRENPLAGSLAPNAKKKIRKLTDEMKVLLTPLLPRRRLLDFRLLEQLELLTSAQANSLEAGASKWIQHEQREPKIEPSPFRTWLGSNLVVVPPRQSPEDFGFDFEEADLEFEQLKELEAENVARDDEDLDGLSGETLSIADNYTSTKIAGMSEGKVDELMKEQDMWKIPETMRPAVYCRLQAQQKAKLLPEFRLKTKLFNEQARYRRIGLWETDETVLKNQKIIGMTTTGLSKYRGLIAALEPRTVLIEEAAETLEAPVTVACLPSVQQLVLVGDHKQLRPHCHVRAHEDDPMFLNVSLFERMVNNNVEFDSLAKQRRMIPEIRRILRPTYGNLIVDHSSVSDPSRRPNVPGMNGVNSWFFTHQWPEQRDEQMSSFNPDEAEMIVGFIEYLVYNGMDTEEITVLTFYNGQRKKILSDLRRKVSLLGRRFVVVTVDSYQGHENKVVILSLVRSNDKNQIGFLSSENRVCVALSRAQCGFYIFGNGHLLYTANKHWKRVIDIMANKSRKAEDQLKVKPTVRVAEELPLHCTNHNNRTNISAPEDWEKITGGCEIPCKGLLLCGHPCDLRCHPFPHDVINCHIKCAKRLQCGHSCSKNCSEECSCEICQKHNGATSERTGGRSSSDGPDTGSTISTSKAWNSFAAAEPRRYARAIAEARAPLSSSAKSNRESQTQASMGSMSAIADLSLIEDRNSGPPNTSAASQVTSPRIKDQVKAFQGIPGGQEGMTNSSSSTARHETVEKQKKDWSKESSLLD